MAIKLLFRFLCLILSLDETRASMTKVKQGTIEKVQEPLV